MTNHDTPDLQSKDKIKLTLLPDVHCYQAGEAEEVSLTYMACYIIRIEN